MESSSPDARSPAPRGDARWGRRRLAVGIAVTLLVALGVAVGLRLRSVRPGDAAAAELAEIEGAFEALRRAIVTGDDEAFFMMHCEAARREALADFPAVRAGYLAAGEDERSAFRERFHVTEQEFLTGSPRDLVVRILPWRSGWRERLELFRLARVKDVRIEERSMPSGGTLRTGAVLLDIPPELRTSPDQVIEDAYLPAVVFVRDPDGWRRRSFFSEAGDR